MLELIELLEKQISKIEKAILKYTTALNAHDMARRHPSSEEANQLAGAVYENRMALEQILTAVKNDLDIEKIKLFDQMEAEDV